MTQVRLAYRWELFGLCSISIGSVRLVGDNLVCLGRCTCAVCYLSHGGGRYLDTPYTRILLKGRQFSTAHEDAKRPFRSSRLAPALRSAPSPL